MGVFLGFVDTAFTYTTGHAPFGDEALIMHVPGGGSRGRVARWTGLHEVRGLVREVLGGQRPLSILGERDAPAALAEAWAGAALEAEPSSAAVYFGDFKLLANRAGRDALFELTKDPGENNDLLRMPSLTTAGTYSRMRQALALGGEARPGELPEVPPEAIRAPARAGLCAVKQDLS